MSARPLIVGITALSLLATASPALAQQHVVTPAVLQQAMDQQIAADRAKRDVVVRALSRADVRQTAERLGLDVRQASQAIAQLSGVELTQAADAAQALEADLAGGAQTVTISLTTLLLVLLIVVLLAD
ncbi:MAG: hypothetical protein IT184_02680 [Acidobacteria bacterium]|nr:hypothetical protein [Acidobacteriota bacterium]